MSSSIWSSNIYSGILLCNILCDLVGDYRGLHESGRMSVDFEECQETSTVPSGPNLGLLADSSVTDSHPLRPRSLSFERSTGPAVRSGLSGTLSQVLSIPCVYSKVQLCRPISKVMRRQGIRLITKGRLSYLPIRTRVRYAIHSLHRCYRCVDRLTVCRVSLFDAKCSLPVDQATLVAASLPISSKTPGELTTRSPSSFALPKRPRPSKNWSSKPLSGPSMTLRIWRSSPPGLISYSRP